jgi:hypothetical protein
MDLIPGEMVTEEPAAVADSSIPEETPTAETESYTPVNGELLVAKEESPAELVPEDPVAEEDTDIAAAGVPKAADTVGEDETPEVDRTPAKFVDGVAEETIASAEDEVPEAEVPGTVIAAEMDTLADGKQEEVVGAGDVEMEAENPAEGVAGGETRMEEAGKGQDVEMAEGIEGAAGGAGGEGFTAGEHSPMDAQMEIVSGDFPTSQEMFGPGGSTPREGSRKPGRGGKRKAANSEEGTPGNSPPPRLKKVYAASRHHAQESM